MVKYYNLPSGEHTKSELERFTMLLMGKSTISMAIFNCYVSSPEGTIYVDIFWHMNTYDLMAPRGKERCGWVKSVVTSIRQIMANDCSIHFFLGGEVAIVTIYIYICNSVVNFRWWWWWWWWWWWSRNCLLGHSGVVPLAAALDAGLVSTKEVESVDLGLKWGGEWWWDFVADICSRYK